jgi:hypothetical protein
MESENLPKSLFEQIVDHALDSLRASNEFDSVLLQKIQTLTQEEQLSKPASLVSAIKGSPEDNK